MKIFQFNYTYLAYVDYVLITEIFNENCRVFEFKCGTKLYLIQSGYIITTFAKFLLYLKTICRKPRQ